MRQEQPPIHTDLSKVFDLALEYNPNLATADLSTIRYWVSCGCDVELDILPTMSEVIKRRSKAKSKISTFSYFTNPVMASHDKRKLAPKPTLQLSKQDTDAAKAKALRWMKDKNIITTKYGPQDFVWLEQYEQKHGVASYE